MLKSTTANIAVVVAFTGFFAAGAATTAFADSQWQYDHPRREQINNRLATQNLRIHREVKAGDLTKAQATQLHANDHQIRQEERAMASQNGGQLTKLEQKTLNQQENRVSHKIGE